MSERPATKRKATRKPLTTVHKVCTMLRKHEATHRGTKDYHCKECPAWKETPYGKGKQMCRGMAEEMIAIVKFGNPWGKKYQRSRRFWGLKGWRDMK